MDLVWVSRTVLDPFHQQPGVYACGVREHVHNLLHYWLHRIEYSQKDDFKIRYDILKDLFNWDATVTIYNILKNAIE